jgi:hypothetical protein
MPGPQCNDNESPGRVEVLPNGQHRWVPPTVPPVNPTANRTVSLDYRAEAAQPHGRWWKSLLGFLLGAPLGFSLAGLVGQTLWPAMSRHSPAGIVLAASLAVFVSGGFWHHAGRRFLGWLAFGAGCGLMLAGTFFLLFWGWRDC